MNRGAGSGAGAYWTMYGLPDPWPRAARALPICGCACVAVIIALNALIVSRHLATA